MKKTNSAIALKFFNGLPDHSLTKIKTRQQFHQPENGVPISLVSNSKISDIEFQLNENLK